LAWSHRYRRLVRGRTEFGHAQLVQGHVFVCFALDNGHPLDELERQLSAKSGHSGSEDSA
jgi:hypothetical protein